MKRTRLAALAVFMSLVAVASIAAPVSAQEVIASQGKTGDWGYSPADDDSTPGAKCGYSAPHEDGFAYLRWIKVRGPVVVARDITGGADHQQVSWQVIVQRSSSSGWKTIKKSSLHQFTADDGGTAAPGPIKVYVKATNDQDWRAVIKINWIRNGATEGWVKASMTYYGVKWTVGSPDFVYTNACDGRAD
jgi:hypothetical protein